MKGKHKIVAETVPMEANSEEEPEFILGLDNDDGETEEDDHGEAGKSYLGDTSKPLIDEKELPFYMDLIKQINAAIQKKNRIQRAAVEKRKRKIVEIVEELAHNEDAFEVPSVKSEETEVPDRNASPSCSDIGETDSIIDVKPILVRHVNVEEYPNPGARVPECRICEQIFKTVTDYKAHMKIAHLDSLPYQCNVCKKYFRTPPILRQHQRFHGPKIHKCKVCNEAFVMKAHLRRHEEVHEQDRPFRCALCPKMFTQKSNFDRHAVVHNRLKAFECITCDKAFTLRDSLIRHCRKKNHVC